MKRTKFNFISFYDIEVISARTGEKFKIGKVSQEMPNIWGCSSSVTDSEGNTYFYIAFNERMPLTMELISHECFHMFFQILWYQGEERLKSESLVSEIYAMAFETLVGKVLRSLCDMGVLNNKEVE